MNDDFNDDDDNDDDDDDDDNYNNNKITLTLTATAAIKALIIIDKYNSFILSTILKKVEFTTRGVLGTVRKEK